MCTSNEDFELLNNREAVKKTVLIRFILYKNDRGSRMEKVEGKPLRV